MDIDSEFCQRIRKKRKEEKWCPYLDLGAQCIQAYLQILLGKRDGTAWSPYKPTLVTLQWPLIFDQQFKALVDYCCYQFCVAAGCFHFIMEIKKKQSHESPFKIIHLFVTVLYKCLQNSPLLRVIFYTLFSTPKQRAQPVFFTCVLYAPHSEEVACSTCSSPYNETSDPSSCVLSYAAASTGKLKNLSQKEGWIQAPSKVLNASTFWNLSWGEMALRESYIVCRT